MQFDLWGELHDIESEVTEIERFFNLTLIPEKKIIIPQGKFNLIGEMDYETKLIKSLDSFELYLLYPDGKLLYLCKTIKKLKDIVDEFYRAGDLYPDNWEDELRVSFFESRIIEIDPSAITRPEAFWPLILNSAEM